MSSVQSDETKQQRPLRLWPGVVAVLLQSFAWYVVPIVVPPPVSGYIAGFGALVGGLAVVLWWLFFSRAPWSERVGAIVLIGVGLAVTLRLIHESIATGGMGMLFYVYAIPVLCLALVGWAVASRNLSAGPRRATLVMTILVACGVWTLMRTDGVSDTGSDFAWRWAETSEQRLLAQDDNTPTAHPSTRLAAETEAEWPGFRGPNRDGIVPGVRIETDWVASPPVELWRQPVGPGWSSFAVHGDFLYTQEQRGDDETVSCYDAKTGESVWRHQDAVRFWESNAGAGPRGTPSVSRGRVYTFGATGILNALDAVDGAVVWSRDMVSDIDAETPYWGFSSSPLVVDDVVIVGVRGQLAAYDLATGDSRWLGSPGGASYSSPHLVTIGGIEQVLLVGAVATISVAPADGTLLWEHAWPGYPAVQPALTEDGDVLIVSDERSGIRRLAVSHEPGGWTAKERWTSTRLKPYFNDFVVHNGHAFGFDGSILACIDLADGERRWKGGRYGQGQLVLLPDEDALLVVSSRGELALVSATPEKFTQLARMPAIDGKTWNHPVVVGDLLLLRNAQEMAAFRLPIKAE